MIVLYVDRVFNGSANLFNAKFYTVEKFTLGHVVAHGAAGSASVYAHAQFSASGRTCTSWLIMWLCQSASQSNWLVVLQLHWQRLPREGTYNRIAFFWKAPVDNSDSRISLVCHNQTPHVSLLFDLILPCRHFQAAYSFVLRLVPLPAVSVDCLMFCPSPTMKRKKCF